MGSENTQSYQVRSYFDLTPDSCNQFTRECVVARGENLQSDHES